VPDFESDTCVRLRVTATVTDPGWLETLGLTVD
jgi:hypothetical protein